MPNLTFPKFLVVVVNEYNIEAGSQFSISGTMAFN